MIKRINRTRRKRIETRDITLSLRSTQGGEAPVFDLDLRLAGYGFPPEATVRVEVSRGNAVQRWDYGTAGLLTPPPDGARRLTEVAAGAQFRIFVVAGDGSGRLLGHAPHLRPKLPLDSLLPLEERDDLGEEVWRVDFGEDGGEEPVLLVNASVAGISEAVRSDAAFRTLVLPEVFRVILTHMLFTEEADPEDEEDETWGRWFAIAKAYLPEGEPPRHLGGIESTESREAARDEAREWINDVVAALAKEPLKAATTYGEALGGDGS